MPKLLALDMSPSAIGWTLLEHGRAPRFDTWKPPAMFAEDDYGRLADKTFDWLSGHVELLQPDAVAAEAPLVPNSYGGKMETTTHTVIMLTGLVWTAELVAHRASIRFLRVHHEDAKIALLGRGRNVKKVHMKGACHDRKWLVATEHEADAIGVGLHANEILWPKARP